MSNKEDYLTFNRKNMSRYLSDEERMVLEHFHDKIRAGRKKDGKKNREFLVIFEGSKYYGEYFDAIKRDEMRRTEGGSGS